MTHVNGRVWSVGKLLLLAGALVATFVLFAGIAMRTALRVREVQVPQLVGRPVNEASQALTDLGLALKVDANRRVDEKIPSGHIMQQDPPAGAPARTTRTIRVWVSAGPHAAKVPELVGQTERTARITLAQDGLDVASVTEFRSTDYPADAVVAQDPAPDVASPHVSLLLNRGEEAATYLMPDVIGMDGTKAAEALRSFGFRVSITGTQPYQGVPAGTVVKQQPSGGFRVAQGDAIALEVSQ